MQLECISVYQGKTIDALEYCAHGGARDGDLEKIMLAALPDMVNAHCAIESGMRFSVTGYGKRLALLVYNHISAFGANTSSIPWFEGGAMDMRWTRMPDETGVPPITVVVTTVSAEALARTEAEMLMQVNAHFAEHRAKTSAEKLQSTLTALSKRKYTNSLQRVRDKVDATKEAMHEAILRTIENTTKLETIALKAEELQQSAGVFKKHTVALRRKMWWRNARWKIAIALIVVCVIVVLCTSIALAVPRAN